jgi:selenide,water dikinase
MTDITGFSLLGHASEMAKSSGVGIRFSFRQIPFVSGARKYGSQWAFPGGASDNRHYFEAGVTFDPALDEVDRMLLFDPQTSGGLLMGVPPERLSGFLETAQSKKQPVWEIGEVFSGSGIQVNA